MDDVQNQASEIMIDIDKVGVRDITYPLRVKSKGEGTQDTIAKIAMYVSLPKEFKGTHMSRFVSILNRHRKKVNVNAMEKILSDMLNDLEAESSYIKMKFPYFIDKAAPVSGEQGLMDYKCQFDGFSSTSGEFETTATVKVPITSVCPCSKTISDRGAHNQRGIIKIKFPTIKPKVWIEDVIALAEESASCALFPLLKRPDEKWVTETAYDNPKFVEDIVREVASRLLKLNLTAFKVSVTNFESIHNHSAYAEISHGKFLR